MIRVRTAVESDAESIAELFQAVYGKDYSYPLFYDPHLLKKLIYSDDSVVVVAVDEASGCILGTASVLEEAGAYTDLVGEFGRLAVHPDARQQGIGRMLMAARLERVQGRLHVGLVEARLVRTFSSRISLAFRFAPVGYLPSKFLLGGNRENLALLVRYFAAALSLRRNHPRIIPEAFQLAHLAMENCSLAFDAIVDDEAAPYPYNDQYRLEQLSTEGYSSLLRIERGRLRKREIFGQMRLHYGVFKLRATNSTYLLARDQEGRLTGAIGYTIDNFEKMVLVFELLALRDDVVRTLFEKLIQECRERCDTKYIEVSVSAYYPRMQRTLLELGFLPAAYIPAAVFHKVGRLDIIRMVRVFDPIDSSRDELLPEIEAIAKAVMRNFLTHDIQPRLLQAVRRVGTFSGLNEEQRMLLASCCNRESFQEGECIFRRGSESEKVYLILKGEVTIHPSDEASSIGSVGSGECLGEAAALSGVLHSASAKTRTAVEAAVIRRSELMQLIRLRPDIGVVIFRNLAIGLGKKLQRSDLALLQK